MVGTNGGGREGKKKLDTNEPIVMGVHLYIVELSNSQEVAGDEMQLSSKFQIDRVTADE